MEKTFTVVIMRKQEIISSDLITINGNDMYGDFDTAVDAWLTIIDNLAHPQRLPDIGKTEKPLSWQDEEWLIQLWICKMPEPTVEVNPETNPTGNFDFV